MREVLRLADPDCRILVARYREHGNSVRRMRQALVEADSDSTVPRLAALREMERRTGVDLGEICHRFERRDDPGTHAVERLIMNFIAEQRLLPDGRVELWVLLDRIRCVHELKDGRLVGEPDS
jgi:hypothetical protein